MSRDPQMVLIRERLSQMNREAHEHIRWMAQTVHQSYHADIGGIWSDCPRDICASTNRLWNDWRERILKLGDEVMQ